MAAEWFDKIKSGCNCCCTWAVHIGCFVMCQKCWCQKCKEKEEAKRNYKSATPQEAIYIDQISDSIVIFGNEWRGNNLQLLADFQENRQPGWKKLWKI